MSDGNGHAVSPEDEARIWREHGERFDAVRALERRLGSLESAVRDGTRDVRADIGELTALVTQIATTQRNTNEVLDRFMRLVNEHDKRIAALETRPARARKKRK